MKNLDYVFPISEDAVKYLHNKGIHNNNIISRWGEGNDYGKCMKKKDKSLIDSLALVKHPIQWVHFGGGSEYDNLRYRANEKFEKSNVVSFEMYVDTSKENIMDYYKKII